MYGVKPLTKRQRECLDYIVEYLREHYCQPTIREMCIHMGIASTNGVNDHLRRLAIKGYIGYQDGSHGRALVITEKTRKMYNLYFTTNEEQEQKNV